jgi:hypothetical protein
MAKLELRLDYQGAITNPKNLKKDFGKAMKIIGLSFLSSSILSVGLFLLIFLL